MTDNTAAVDAAVSAILEPARMEFGYRIPENKVRELFMAGLNAYNETAELRDAEAQAASYDWQSEKSDAESTQDAPPLPTVSTSDTENSEASQS